MHPLYTYPQEMKQMSDTVNTNQEDEQSRARELITTDLFGRRTIFSSVEQLNEDNIIDEVNSALAIHLENLFEEERLYWYRKGVQPILWRKKENNDFVNHKIVENHAEEICSFKNGYFMTQPAYYIARKCDVQEKVETLNEYLYRSGKLDADNETVDWFHTVGYGYIYVEPNKGDDADEVPFHAYALRPMQAFVAYSMKPGNEPVYAGNVVTVDKKIFLDIWTKEKCYRLNGTLRGELATTDPETAVTAINLVDSEPNIVGEIPIIEYRYNMTGMGAFEPVIGILDAINGTDSDRSDGITQFIESLLVITNADLDDGENASTIRERGMILIKSTQELTAKVEMLTQQLDQSQTQTYVDHLIRNMLLICGMPNRSESGAVYNATGVATLSSYGWYQADAFARNTEDLFKKSNRRFDRIILKILERKNLLKGLSLNDFELHFVRNETANIQSKAQAFNTLVASGLHPELAAAKSGVSNDPVSDMAMSEKWLKLMWGDPDAPAVPEGGTSQGGPKQEQPPREKSPGQQTNGAAEKLGQREDPNYKEATGQTWIAGYWQKR